MHFFSWVEERESELRIFPERRDLSRGHVECEARILIERDVFGRLQCNEEQRLRIRAFGFRFFLAVLKFVEKRSAFGRDE